MAVDFTDFTTGGTLASDNYLVGYDVDASGGEKKWKYSTLLKSVSADIPAVKDVVDSSTINLTFNSSTGTLSADVTTAVRNASSFNTFNTQSINLNWDVSTRTLSANLNQNISSYNKTYDVFYDRSGTFTWSTAAAGSNPKNYAFTYSWPSNGFATTKYSTKLISLDSDSFSLDDDFSVFITHNIYNNYDGATGQIAIINSYDYSLDNGVTWINSLSADIQSVKIIRSVPTSGDVFDNVGSSSTGTCLLTAGKATSLKIRPNFQLASDNTISLTRFKSYGSVIVSIQKI